MRDLIRRLLKEDIQNTIIGYHRTNLKTRGASWGNDIEQAVKKIRGGYRFTVPEGKRGQIDPEDDTYGFYGIYMSSSETKESRYGGVVLKCTIQTSNFLDFRDPQRALQYLKENFDNEILYKHFPTLDSIIHKFTTWYRLCTLLAEMKIMYPTVHGFIVPISKGNEHIIILHPEDITIESVSDGENTISI